MPNRGGCILCYSPLTNRVFAVTRWSERGNGVIVAQVKHDVTESFVRLRKQLRGKRLHIEKQGS